MIGKRIRLVLATAGWLWAVGAQAQTPGVRQVEAELAPQSAAAVPGSTVHVALRQKIRPGWHTYWRNPGDSGDATRIAWTLPAGWRAGEIVWPTPERQPIGPLVNYGYSDEVYLPVPIAVPASARPGETVTLRAAASWLVCEQICIPESAELVLRLPVSAEAPRPHPRFGRSVAATLEAAPKLAGLTGAVRRDGGRLRLAATGEALRGADLSGAYFFPYDGALIDHASPQAVERGPGGLTLTLTPARPDQPLDGPVGGVLALADRAFELEAAPGPLPAAAAGLGPPPGPGGGRGLPLALGLAFLGGLILNLMPCVFPVLSMKALALAAHAHDRAAARVRGVAFLAGVLTAFAALGLALTAARAAGEAAGWGFQLQSPPVVAALALLMLLVGLNLSGVFHARVVGQDTGAGLTGRAGAAGAFFTGALAVVVAAPCTAPFMAGALGYAVVQPPLTAVLVFLALGAGLAAPFTALSFAPGLLGRLPRPGPWMDRLKRLLALPMYAAAAWLAWVFARQTGQGALGLLLLGAALTACAAWLYGAAQHGRPSDRTLRGAAAMAAAGALVVVFVGATRLPQDVGEPPGGEAYTPARLAALRAEGRPVLVNFTADWCVTCKVNERLALSGPRLEQALRRTGAIYLEADWTRRDPVIARALAEHGRSGVPLYLLYPPGAEAPVILPQLLTEGAVVKALEDAARRPVRTYAAGGGVAGPGGEVITSTLSLSR